jgi:hypothetical protein
VKGVSDRDKGSVGLTGLYTWEGYEIWLIFITVRMVGTALQVNKRARYKNERRTKKWCFRSRSCPRQRPYKCGLKALGRYACERGMGTTAYHSSFKQKPRLRKRRSVMDYWVLYTLLSVRSEISKHWMKINIWVSYSFLWDSRCYRGVDSNSGGFVTAKHLIQSKILSLFNDQPKNRAKSLTVHSNNWSMTSTTKE